MSDTPARYSLADLCDLADVTARTVRFYVAEGLLRSPGSGSGAKYDDGHLWRIRLIKSLQREHLPLAEIRARLAALGDDEVRELAKRDRQPSASRGGAVEYVRAVLAGRGVAPALRAAAPSQTTEPAAQTRPSPPAAAFAVRHLAAAGEPSGPDRSQWERILLAPDVELHIRRPLTRTQNRRVADLVTIARQLLEEDQ